MIQTKHYYFCITSVKFQSMSDLTGKEATAIAVAKLCIISVAVVSWMLN